MTVERGLRAMAGGLVLVSLALGYFVHNAFYLLTAFVGLNLLQSAFTNWCPAVLILRKIGLPDAEGGCCGGTKKADEGSCCGGEKKAAEGGCCRG